MLSPMKSLLLPAQLLLATLGSALLQDGDPARNSATVPTPRTDEGILARQAECVRRARETARADVLFIGDSITQGWEDTGRAAWERHFAPLGALDLGVSGDRTEHVLWRLQEAPVTRLAPRVIVLLIGTNNLGHGTHDGEATLAGVRSVVELLRQQAPGAQLLVHEIFPRGERFNPMRGEIAQLNQALRSLAGEGVGVLPIGDRWVRADGSISSAIMPDFLHLSAEGYAQWAEALLPSVKAALR